MSATVETNDWSDLGFDVTPHREALAAFARMNLDAASIRPALRARDLAFVRVPSGKIRILVESGEKESSGARAIVHESDTVEGANAIRAEVERYFQRHFPGRLVPGTAEAGADGETDPPYRVVCVVL